MTSLNSILGLGVGFVLVIIPEPVTTALGLAIMGFSAYKAGWLGKGGI